MQGSPELERVVEVLAPPRDGHDWGYGSGYLVASGLVITAHHVVAGVRRALVRFEGGRAGEHEAWATVLRPSRALDLALLRLGPQDTYAVERVPLADPARTVGALPFVAVGFPVAKRTTRDGAPLRDSDQVDGTIPLGSNLKQGYLSLETRAHPRPSRRSAADRERSPWDGMSGAAVFTGGALVGVVTLHRSPEGNATLTAVRIAAADDPAIATSAERARFRRLLGLRARDSIPSLEPEPDASRRPATSRDVSDVPNPYLGLRAFGYADRESFAGRARSIEEAIADCTSPGDERALLLVIGPSGSGKSSFVQAGLLPALERHHGERGRTARAAVFRPGKRPLAMLADALAQLGLPGAAAADEMTVSAEAFAAFLAEHTPAGQVNLLVVDQLEELFTQATPDERAPLLDMLSAPPPFAHARTHHIVTLRSDYLGELYVHKALYEAAKTGIDLREMTEPELREAIQRPLEARARVDARFAGRAWAPELVTVLAEQAASRATYLPLLQLTLDEIWRGGQLTLAAYRAMGGQLTSAIGDRSNTVLDFVDHELRVPRQPRPAADRQTLLDLLLGLIHVVADPSGRADVRRRRTRTELIGEPPAAERQRLLDDLVRARLLSGRRRKYVADG